MRFLPSKEFTDWYMKYFATAKQDMRYLFDQEPVLVTCLGIRSTSSV